MSKLTEKMTEAVRAEKNFSMQNTEVKISQIGPSTFTEVYYHGSKIFYKEANFFCFNFCGYITKSTQERINALVASMGYPSLKLTSKNGNLIASTDGKKLEIFSTLSYKIDDLFIKVITDGKLA